MALSATPLSKSRYLSGLQCQKRLYWEVHRRDLLPTEVAPSQQAVFDAGNEVGELARRRHPGGVLIEADHFHHREAVEATKLAMADPAVPAIFEAAFTHDGIKIRADILIRNADGTWDMQEVKATTSVKEVHLPDLAVQVYVLEGCGIKIRRAGILHLDRDYVLGERGLDLSALFRSTEVSALLPPHLSAVAANVPAFRTVLDQPAEPAISAGDQCYSPYECPFTHICVLPQGPYDLGQIPRGAKVVAAMAALGVDDVRNVPAGTTMSSLQMRVVTSVASGKEYVGTGLRAALESVAFPLLFLDFETFAPAIPRYVGTRVYQALPTQWSLHTLDRDGGLTHAEHLHNADTDPRLAFAESLLDVLGRKGSIVVYSSYEATQIRALAFAIPSQSAALLGLLPRFVDLLTIVRAHYYHPAFGGSFSIKSVLPALVPKLAYDDLAVQDGSTAAVLYGRMVNPGTSAEEAAGIREALLRYCERDTLAMVEVREALLARCP